MRQVRRIAWAGLVVSAAATAIGLVFAIGSAVAAGDWDLAPMPWIGIGLRLIVVGLALGACFGVLLDVIEPIGRWRLLALPPALLVGAFWAFVLIVGLPTSGGPDSDVPTILYTLPAWMAMLVIATVTLALPAVVGRRVATGR